MLEILKFPKNVKVFSIFVLQVVYNGAAKDVQSKKKEQSRSKESFEEVPLYTAVMTYMGFYLLVVLGYLNQFLFAPPVAKEKNRKVCVSFSSELNFLYAIIFEEILNKVGTNAFISYYLLHYFAGLCTSI